MDVEFSTPIPITFLETVRCVFYFKPQRVADTFDNIPQFYLDVVERKNPDNIQRLYVTFKVRDVFFIDTDSMRAKADGVALHLKDYLKKHFGSKFALIEPMVRQLDNLPYPMKDVIFDILNRKQMISEEVVADYMTTTKKIDSEGHSKIRISPALTSAYVFTFTDNPPEEVSPHTVLSGTAVLFGEPMFFEVDNLSNYQIEKDVFPQFVSPWLVEDTLNHALRTIHEKDENALETYVQDVKFTEST